MNDDNLSHCEHSDSLFISSSRGTGCGITERSLIRVCKNCGLIMIRATINGVSFYRDFHIHQHDVLDSMRKWADYVEREDV